MNRGEGSALFYLTTRRGRQFNSIIYGDRDPLTGSRRRDDIFISPEDAARLGLHDADPILLSPAAHNPRAASANCDPPTFSPTSNLQPRNSSFRGVCRIAPVAPGTLQAYWPEANVLIPSRLDPQSHEPDYNAWVTLEKL